MRFPAITALAGLFLVAACADDTAPTTSPTALAAAQAEKADKAADAGVHRYRVTLENLSTSQVFSPGVLATHTKDVSVWSAGAAASEGIRLIAEDGDETRAVADVANMNGVYAVVDINTPTNRIGGQAPLPNPQVFEITARGNANRLSLAVMTICTNDGFTGVDGVKLPSGSKPDVYEAGVWDAGTEQNNELFNQIVDPCGGAGPVPAPADGNGRVPTSDVIRRHANIQGVGDLSVALHGWQGPVARITIERID
ncbi:MAG: spondin domain-containing protein [Gemmatimonadales bacterium]